jgi:Ankyrin repeats (many copies)
MSTTHPTKPEVVPLHYAAGFGLCDMVEYLVTKYPEDVDARGGNHETPLQVALSWEFSAGHGCKECYLSNTMPKSMSETTVIQPHYTRPRPTDILS